MRIVAGKYRGRTLCEFDGNKIRPTADKVRESIFNIIQFKVAGSDFLDLFAGTGAMGIEALSRGANSATFNDLSRDSLVLIKKNLEKLKVDESYKLTSLDASIFVKNCTDKFDIVFIDPPYDSKEKSRCLNGVANVLKENGTVIFEDEKEWIDNADGLVLYDKRKYGRVHLAFFKKGE